MKLARKPSSGDPLRAITWADVQVEIAVAAVSAFVLAAAITRRETGALAILAMLGLVFATRGMVVTLLARLRERRKLR